MMKKISSLNVNPSRIQTMRKVCREYPAINLMDGFMYYQKIMQAKLHSAPKQASMTFLDKIDSYCVQKQVIDGRI
jgi:hypothetical protein